MQMTRSERARGEPMALDPHSPTSAFGYLDALVTLPELAERLGISEATLKRKVRNGAIGCVRLSRSQWRFTNQQIIDYLSRCTSREVRSLPQPLTSQGDTAIPLRPAMSARAAARLASRSN